MSCRSGWYVHIHRPAVKRDEQLNSNESIAWNKKRRRETGKGRLRVCHRRQLAALIMFENINWFRFERATCLRRSTTAAASGRWRTGGGGEAEGERSRNIVFIGSSANDLILIRFHVTQRCQKMFHFFPVRSFNRFIRTRHDSHPDADAVSVQLSIADILRMMEIPAAAERLPRSSFTEKKL